MDIYKTSILVLLQDEVLFTLRPVCEGTQVSIRHHLDSISFLKPPNVSFSGTLFELLTQDQEEQESCRTKETRPHTF